MDTTSMKNFISQTDIKGTKAFQQSIRVIQRMILSRTNVKAINIGINTASEIGFDVWKNKTTAGSKNQRIIKELINKLN